MLSTSYIYVQQKTTNKENHHQMAEGNPEKPKSPNKQLSDSDTLDEEPINPILKTSVEERHYGTITGSALATQAALNNSRAQANPTLERGPSHKVRVKNFLKKKPLINQHKLRNKRNKLSNL